MNNKDLKKYLENQIKEIGKQIKFQQDEMRRAINNHQGEYYHSGYLHGKMEILRFVHKNLIENLEEKLKE